MEPLEPLCRQSVLPEKRLKTPAYRRLQTLARHKLLEIGLRLMQKLLAAAIGAVQVGHKLAGVQGHVKLKMCNVFAEVFPQGGSGDGFSRRNQSVLLHVPAISRIHVFN